MAVDKQQTRPLHQLPDVWEIRAELLPQSRIVRPGLEEVKEELQRSRGHRILQSLKECHVLGEPHEGGGAKGGIVGQTEPGVLIGHQRGTAQSHHGHVAQLIGQASGAVRVEEFGEENVELLLSRLE